jgi:hypothetical protein
VCWAHEGCSSCSSLHVFNDTAALYYFGGHKERQLFNIRVHGKQLLEPRQATLFTFHTSRCMAFNACCPREEVFTTLRNFDVTLTFLGLFLQ